MTCESKNWFSGYVATKIGVFLGTVITPHEIMEHHTRECKPARIELAAFILHILKVQPHEISEVKDRLVNHLKNCHCGDGRELHH